MKNFIRVVGEFEHVDVTCLKKIEKTPKLKGHKNDCHNLPFIIFLKILNVG